MRSKKRARVKQAVSQMRVDMDKYFDLVWFARAKPKMLLDREIYEGLSAYNRIKEQYPKETFDIKNPDDDNWTHGFNSGMLAASRLYFEMIEGDPEFAKENFPELDS